MRKKIYFTLAICCIVGGIWFSSTNGYTFLKGYFLYKTGDNKVITSPVVDASMRESGDRNIVVPLYPSRPEIGDEIGLLSIPKINASLPIFHGTDEDELERGVGHYAGSVLPGEQDNSVLAGHRDTVFRKLGEVGVDDLLIVTTAAGQFTYKVQRVRIVDSDDRTVIVPRPRATLTVSTCYPFQYIGNAPERYILEATLIQSEKNDNNLAKASTK
ncbi:class D sortase [Evansella cellulosilytica]|uniref:class D sortase n=1 Tax=Evansella cellulosilytica TaxID=1413 RepID=UPI0003161877|nr:class D sortase [Evansella cellulosilytica]